MIAQDLGAALMPPVMLVCDTATRSSFMLFVYLEVLTCVRAGGWRNG